MVLRHQALVSHQLLGKLEGIENDSLRAETPIFAADAQFARDMGGPITLRFLDALPEEWRSSPLMIDAALVGLARNFDPGPRQFHREPCPEQSGGAWEAANGEREVEHIFAAFGPSLPQLVTGSIDEASLPAVIGWKQDDVLARDRKIRALIDAGKNGLVTPAEGTLIQHGSAQFLRWPPAKQWGFHFWIRATRGSRRPYVNGLRTHAQL